MNVPHLVEVPQYDFSDIDGYGGYDVPIYAAASGEPGVQGYRYAEVYGDGTLRLCGSLVAEEPFVFLTINPRNGRRRASDFLASDPERILPHLYEILRAGGVPDSALSRRDSIGEYSLAQGDPSAGAKRDAARQLIGIAFGGLQASRWYNFETASSHHPQMERQNYRDSLNSIVQRFGVTALLEEAKYVFGDHLDSLHSSVHTPGLEHKTHSDSPSPKEAYMDTARQIIRNQHNILQTVKGHVANNVSLFGDADFWASLREDHYAVFDSLVDHLLSIPTPYRQPIGRYWVRACIDPVRLIEQHFPQAYQEIITARPDFASAASDMPTIADPENL